MGHSVPIILAANGAVEPGTWSLSVDVESTVGWSLIVTPIHISDGIEVLTVSATAEGEWELGDSATATLTVTANGVEYVLTITITVTML
jgi:hypothetical protein